MPQNKFSQTYYPHDFCREYVGVKGNSVQLVMFMAVVLGIKPLMDDWVPVERWNEFKKVCRKYKLKVRENVVFDTFPKEDLPDSIIGKEYLTTTSAYGYPLKAGCKGQVHVFIAREEAVLRKGMWYPVIVRGRVIFQPRMDSLSYGYVLGYPDCCIKFFRKYNNWLKYSYLYEAYRNTRGTPSFFCNPFLKDTSFSYIYHMPCSYNCSATIKLAGGLRKAILKREPGYVQMIDERLKMPFLVFYERKFYCFDGLMKANRVCYKKPYFPSPDFKKDTYGKFLSEADTLQLDGYRLKLTKKGKDFKNLNVGPQGNFAPEYPFLIDFS